MNCAKIASTNHRRITLFVPSSNKWKSNTQSAEKKITNHYPSSLPVDKRVHRGWAKVDIHVAEVGVDEGNSLGVLLAGVHNDERHAAVGSLGRRVDDGRAEIGDLALVDGVGGGVGGGYGEGNALGVLREELGDVAESVEHGLLVELVRLFVHDDRRVRQVTSPIRPTLSWEKVNIKQIDQERLLK